MKLLIKDKKRFFDKVKKTKGCWEWIGGKFYHGYGVFKFNYKTWKAHRFSRLIHNGFIPKGMCVCHTCDNKLCVNPKHLWLGTKSDNNKDRDKKGRMAHNCGEKHGRSKLTEKQVLEIRKIYKAENISQEKLGKRFNVCRQSIGHIINKQNWQHI